jgi:membrane-associated phospholipid phosphatase
MKFSKFISYFFHPINFPIIGSILYFLLIPEYIFKPLEHLFLTVIVLGTYIFPLFLLILLKHFDMINSYQMVTIEERKFPTLLFTSISFFLGFWLYNSTVVDILSLFFVGYGLALICSYLLLYFKLKISLHGAAIGGLIGFLIYFSYHYKINLIIILSIFFLISGLIASSRLRLHAHNPYKIFLGYFLGMLTQFIVYFMYYII